MVAKAWQGSYRGAFIFVNFDTIRNWYLLTKIHEVRTREAAKGRSKQRHIDKEAEHETLRKTDGETVIDGDVETER